MFKILILLFIIPFILLFYNCKTNDINFQFTIREKLFLDKSSLKDIKINGKIVLLDITNDIGIYKKANDTTDDILNSGKFIYKKEDLDIFNKYLDVFYNFTKENLEKNFKKENINIKILFNSDNIIDQSSDKEVLFIEIQEYYEGQYNLIKNEATKFKISVKLYQKDLINNSIVLFIRNYKCKSNILFPTEKLRIENITNLFSEDIIKTIKKIWTK